MSCILWLYLIFMKFTKIRKFMQNTILSAKYNKQFCVASGSKPIFTKDFY